MRVDARLVALALVGGIASGLAWSVQALYLRSLGYTGTVYGILGGLSIAASILFTLAGGLLSDMLGARKVLASSLALGATSTALVSTGDERLVALGFFLNGVSAGLGGSSQQALVARSGRDEELHYAFSYVTAASTLGGAIGSFMGWIPVIVSEKRGIQLVEAYRLTLQLLPVLPLVGVLLVLGLKEAGGVSRDEGSSLYKLKAFRRLGRRFYYVVVAEMVIGFGAAMSIHNIDYYFAAKYRVTSAGLGTVLGVQQLVMALIMTRMPRIADRYGGILRVYLLATSSSIPLLIAMTFTSSYTVAAGLYIVRSILMNVANPLFNAFALRLAPRSSRGLASALLSLSWSIPAGGGRVVGGLLLDVDLELPLRLTALLYSTALAWLALVFREELGKTRTAMVSKREAVHY